MLVEGSLSELLHWRNAIASAATGKLPDTPMHSPKEKTKLEPQGAADAHKEAVQGTAATSVIQLSSKGINQKPAVWDLKLAENPKGEKEKRTVACIKGNMPLMQAF
jgi:hypothetical protein